VADGNLDDVANRIHSAAIHLLRRVAAVDAESGLSAARLSALSVIVYAGPLTMTALADAEQVSPATITSTVGGLERAGLVERRREGTDARRVTVGATPAGQELMDESRHRRIAVVRAGLTALPDADVAAIARAATALERMLGETGHRAAADPEPVARDGDLERDGDPGVSRAARRRNSN